MDEVAEFPASVKIHLPTNEVAKKIFFVNNSSYDRTAVRKILILYNVGNFFIGDSCRFFSYLRGCQSFFENGLIDISCHKQCGHLLKNNPFVNQVFCSEWDDLPLNQYDVIVVISGKEKELLLLLERKYKETILDGSFGVAVFSFTKLYRAQETVFPFYEELSNYLVDFGQTFSRAGNEICISAEEKEWGNNWLEVHGLKPTDKLAIMLDNSTNSNKLLSIDVYFQMVEFFLQKGFKILIFDEKGIGKKGFYEEWLGKTAARNLICAENLDLRKALCLLSSDYTKFILGPCTGLLHCATGIYNKFMIDGMSPERVPAMMTYAGKDKKTDDRQPEEWYWWGDSLVDCVMLKQSAANRKVVVKLNQYNGEDYLSCKEFTSELLIDFINRQYEDKLHYCVPAIEYWMLKAG